MFEFNSDFKAKIDLIRESLKTYFLREEGKKLEDLEVYDISKRSFSNIIFLKGKTSSDDVKLVAKMVVHHPINISITQKENQAVVEYNLLKFLHPKFENVEGCSVPRPILVIPEIETYVMEFVEGTLLANELRFVRYFSSKNKFKKLEEYYYYCGRWLKHFQEFTGIQKKGPEALIGVIERCDYRLKLIEELKDPRIPKNLRNQVIGYLKEKFSQMNGENVYVSGRHGDFGPWNILVGPIGVLVIDYLGYGEDPIAFDIIKMLMNFEDEKNCITSNLTRINDLKNSFLEGYGPLPVVSSKELIICETYHRICSILGSLSKERRQFHHKIEKKICLKENLKWLNNEENKKLLWPNGILNS